MRVNHCFLLGFLMLGLCGTARSTEARPVRLGDGLAFKVKGLYHTLRIHVHDKTCVTGGSDFLTQYPFRESKDGRDIRRIITDVTKAGPNVRVRFEEMSRPEEAFFLARPAEYPNFGALSGLKKAVLRFQNSTITSQEVVLPLNL